VNLTIRLLRPDDLLVLSARGENIVLDASDRAAPVLRPAPEGGEARLVFELPPQHLAEAACFEGASPADVQPGTDIRGTPTTPAAPGDVPARIAGPSRLAFRLPPGTAIPYTVAGLLDWSGLDLVVSALAAWPGGEAGAPDIASPGPGETALELPYRLVLSPPPETAFDHARAPVFHGARAELWHTRAFSTAPGLAAGALPLRALWSPDYRAPPLPMPDHAEDDRPFLTSLTPRDRHQIVVRTSAFRGWQVATGATYQPRPIQADRLVLSALGGWLFSRGGWDDLPFPAAGANLHQRDLEELLRRFGGPAAAAEGARGAGTVSPELVRLLGRGQADLASGLLRPGELEGTVAGQPPPATPIPGALDLSGWDHQAALGRDQYVRVVHEGFLYPWGHRAAVVIVTERRIQAAPSGSEAGSPTAYLRQYAFIVRREVERRYREGASDAETRALPFADGVRVETAVTPHLDPPAASQVSGTTWSFWIRVGGLDYPFQLTGRDVTGREVPFSGALIFVPANEARLDLVQAAYADEAHRGGAVASRAVAFAAPSAAGADDATMVATGLAFDGGADGRFLPRLAHADVRVTALEQLLGTSAPTRISLFADYVANGLDGQAGVFADLRPHVPGGLPVGFSADRAGGLATPNLAVTGLSRAQGPVAGALEQAALGTFDPASFFPKGGPDAARILGAISLADLLPAGALGRNAPRLVTAPDPPPPAPPRALVTTFHWTPDLKADLIADLLRTERDSRFTVDGRIVKPVDGGTASTDFRGELTTFTVTLAGVVQVHFDRFAFRSASGQKPSVEVALRAQDPIEFEGALAFVADLAKLIPAGGFGGASLDVSPTGLRLGYGLALPPISIAVFALTDLKLVAGLELPFLSGKPHLDLGFAERSHPFLLTVECLGGGGFVHLELDAEGVILVEGALEFGGQFSIDLGVASGGVHVLAGIYFKLAGPASELAGFVDVGGEVSVLGLVSISVEFNLTLAYFPPQDKAQGRATLVVAVHVAFFSQSVELSVERSFGGHGGDPTFADVTTPEDWQAYAAAFD
jgi:hypothetical protein